MKKQELLRKYLYDQCTHDELQRLYAYLKEDSEEDYKEILYEIWMELKTGQSIDKVTTERIFRKINSEITHTQEEKKVRPVVPLYRTLKRYPYKSVAAAVTGILVIAALAYRLVLYQPLTTATTAYGQTNVLTLPDGSTVHLYANSQLRYSEDWFSSDHREVWLDGEAFFKVEKKLQAQDGVQEHKKFTVHTSVLDIEVIGTRFNVRDRNQALQVVLNSGKIKLKKFQNEEELVMEPGDLVHVSPSRRLKIQKVADPNLYSLWKQNELYFENQTLREIARELRDSHGVVIQFESQEIANQTFTGSTPVNNLQVLFTSIQKSFDLELSQDKNRIFYKEKK